MTPPTPARLALPVEPYVVGGYRFGQRVRRRVILWAVHLGDDVTAPAGAPVEAVGKGEVVWAGVRPGSRQRRNWGGLVIVGHRNKFSSSNFQLAKNSQFSNFYSLYGHLQDVRVPVGAPVAAGQVLGVVAPGNTPANGWWQIPHLHFAIYVGPWGGQVLPGYVRVEDRVRPWARRHTKLAWWRDPQAFIAHYNVSHGTFS